MDLCSLPSDIIKRIIEYCPYGQWFRLCKELQSLALQVISPLYSRLNDHGPLIWSLKNDKILAAISLLKDPRIDPSIIDNSAIWTASQNGYKEIVEMLLKDNRTDPSDHRNSAIRFASEYGRKEVVEVLLKDNRVDPSANNNYAIQYASRNGHKEIVEILLKDNRVNPSVLL